MFQCDDGRLKTAGRLRPLENMIPQLLENVSFVCSHTFFIRDKDEGGKEAEFLLNSHIDGTTEASYTHLLNAVGRAMGLGTLATHPGAVLIQGMHEGKEEIATVFKMFKDGIWPGLNKLYMPLNTPNVAKKKKKMRPALQTSGVYS